MSLPSLFLYSTLEVKSLEKAWGVASVACAATVCPGSFQFIALHSPMALTSGSCVVEAHTCNPSDSLT